jgi:hypothetical protein
VVCFSLYSCRGNVSHPNSRKAITAFSFTDPEATGTINEPAKTISVTVPYGTDVTALTASFTATGAGVKVGSTLQTSGTTPNDFTNPLSYLVIAADNTTALYIVTVAIAPSPAKSITDFSFPDLFQATGKINQSTKTISVTVPWYADATALVADFTTTGAEVKVGSTVQESGVTSNDFTNPVSYVVTAADSTTEVYTVTVTVMQGIGASFNRKIVSDYTSWGKCLSNQSSENFSYSYYENECMAVEPKTPGTSTGSKRVKCYQANDQTWWVQVDTYTDSYCKNPKASSNVKTNNCSNDSNEWYSVYNCRDAAPQTCSSGFCNAGGVCTNGMPHPTCDCPAGTIPPTCGPEIPYKWVYIQQYSSSDGSCSGSSIKTTPWADTCVPTPEGASLKVSCYKNGGTYLQRYLDASCNEPYPYVETYPPTSCKKSPHGDQMIRCPNACDSWECLNGGACVTNGGLPECHCRDGYSGQHCEDH